MIRFIDVRNQETGYRFAFFDTVRDKFCEFGGDQVWDSMEDFKWSFSVSVTEGLISSSEIDRFVGLMPDWALGGDEG